MGFSGEKLKADMIRYVVERDRSGHSVESGWEEARLAAGEEELVAGAVVVAVESESP